MDFSIKNSLSYHSKKRYTWFTITILFYYTCKMVWSLPAKLVLYSDNPGDEATEISGADCPYGAFFTTPDVKFSCACITGVWAFFEEKCRRPALIAAGVNNHCFEMKLDIFKVALLSSPSMLSIDANTSSVAVFSKDMTMLNGRILLKENMQTGTIDKTTQLGNNLSFVTTGKSSWTVKSPSMACLKPEAQGTNNFYCSFGLSNGILGEMDISGSCNDSAIGTNLKPLICSPFLTGSGNCPYTPLVFKNKGAEEDWPKQQGRSFFLQGSERMKDYNATGNDNLDDNITTPVNTSYEIRSEIWNYMIGQAQKIAGLREDKPPKKHNMLAFRLLELCKTLIQKVCPDHYVKDVFFDVTTTVFINVQKNAFKFEEIVTDYPTEQRIVKALTQCTENITQPYPFHDRKLRLPVEFRDQFKQDPKDNDCPVPAGVYKMYDFMLDFEVGPNISSLHHEPIIETAWHSFTHAHAACFKYFKHSDHHRFTTIMMRLFTNGINDHWPRGNYSMQATLPYANALGNLYPTMMFMNHCSTFAKLESEYPWDLLRPEKSKEGKRRRREANQEYQCMKDKYYNDCI